jgi:hypothetical protein
VQRVSRSSGGSFSVRDAFMRLAFDSVSKAKHLCRRDRQNRSVTSTPETLISSTIMIHASAEIACQRIPEIWRSACKKARGNCGDVEKKNKDGILKTNRPTRMCANVTCLCTATDGDGYCGDVCRTRGRDNVEIACQCDHLACPCITALDSVIRPFKHREN